MFSTGANQISADVSDAAGDGCCEFVMALFLVNTLDCLGPILDVRQKTFTGVVRSCPLFMRSLLGM